VEESVHGSYSGTLRFSSKGIELEWRKNQREIFWRIEFVQSFDRVFSMKVVSNSFNKPLYIVEDYRQGGGYLIWIWIKKVWENTRKSKAYTTVQQSEIDCIVD